MQYIFLDLSFKNWRKREIQIFQNVTFTMNKIFLNNFKSN